LLRELYPSDTTAVWYEFHFYSYTPADTVYRYLDEVPGIYYYSATPEEGANGGGVVLQTTEVQEEGLKVFPMPSHGLVHVSVPSSMNSVNFSVFDELGRVIEGIPVQQESDDVWTLDFSNKFPPGIYFIRCGSSSARIILECNQ
jgi:hypothetical protein